MVLLLCHDIATHFVALGLRCVACDRMPRVAQGNAGGQIKPHMRSHLRPPVKYKYKNKDKDKYKYK